MISTTLRIDGQIFVLDHNQNIPALKAALLAAATAGLAFVDFVSARQGTISVLVTPRVKVSFEALESTPALDDDWAVTALTIDYDTYALD